MAAVETSIITYKTYTHDIPCENLVNHIVHIINRLYYLSNKYFLLFI